MNRWKSWSASRRMIWKKTIAVTDATPAVTKRKPEKKNPCLYWIRTLDLRDTGAALHQLSQLVSCSHWRLNCIRVVFKSKFNVIWLVGAVKTTPQYVVGSNIHNKIPFPINSKNFRKTYLWSIEDMNLTWETKLNFKTVFVSNHQYNRIEKISSAAN